MSRFAGFAARLALFAAALSLSATHALAVEFEDARHVARYHSLVRELRCMVCQNQALAESDADLARQMREAVADKLRAGESDEEIIEFMTARYGDFVRYRPRFAAKTALLWIAPFALALLLVLWLPGRLRRRRGPPPDPQALREAEKMLEEEWRSPPRS